MDTKPRDGTGLRWGTLLVLLVAAFLVDPLFGSSRAAEMTSLALFEFAVLGAVFFSAATRWVRMIGLAIAGLWFLSSLAVLSGANLHGLVAALSSVLVLGAVAVTFNHLLSSTENDSNLLLGAIFGYLLLAMAWAVLYLQIERYAPGSFEVPGQTDPWSSMLYFSLVTLTTLGYGDILPLSPIARMATGFEAVAGVLFIAVTVGSIVGSFNRGKER